jgi:hypothetical protein
MDSLRPADCRDHGARRHRGDDPASIAPKRVHHEAHEGHEEKPNDFFMLFMFFMVNALGT